MDEPTKLPMQQTIEALLDDSKILSPRYLYHLSDLSPEACKELRDIWPNISLDRRRAILADLEVFSDSNPLLDFSNLCIMTLSDTDPQVRITAIQTLWLELSSEHVDRLLKIIDEDENIDVKAMAVSALANFVYSGEIEEIPSEDYTRVKDRLVALLQGTEHSIIRQKALEAFGFSNHPLLDHQIEDALEMDDDEWAASALIAMGRSYNRKWEPHVLDFIEHDNPILRMEASKAAGEMELKQASKKLFNLLNDDDKDVRAATIWSLSAIGGEGVMEALESLLEITEDDEEADLIDEAIDNLIFNEGLEDFQLFDIGDETITPNHVEPGIEDL